MDGPNLKAAITQALVKSNGILFFMPMLVGRISYCGRDLLAPNSDLDKYGDERGYALVERWIASKTIAGNDKPKEGEGLSRIIVPGVAHPVLLTEAVAAAETELMGQKKYFDQWPLIKVLDIGGKPVKPNFRAGPGEPEVPPIPCHVHSGTVVNGKLIGPGKLEAYFFPPLAGVEPYNRDLGRVISRLGFKPNTTKAQVLDALKQFGSSDHMYELMNAFELHAHEGWTIPTGVVHAPGPWPTIEIQRAQDDFNFFCWQLGCTLHGPNRGTHREQLVLRGLRDEEDMMAQALDWERCVSPTFKADNHRPAQTLEQGDWGRRYRIFWDNFYGEGVELRAGASYTRAADDRPYAALLWSGRGTANGLQLDHAIHDATEFLVTPRTALHLVAGSFLPMYLYTFFPLLQP